MGFIYFLIWRIFLRATQKNNRPPSWQLMEVATTMHKSKFRYLQNVCVWKAFSQPLASALAFCFLSSVTCTKCPLCIVARLTRLNNKLSLAAESRVRMNWGSVLSVNLEGEELAVRVEIYSSQGRTWWWCWYRLRQLRYLHCHIWTLPAQLGRLDPLS